MNRFIKTIRLTNKTTRTRRKGTTTVNNIINRFSDIIDSVMIFYDSTFMKTFTRTFNYGITTSNRFLLLHYHVQILLDIQVEQKEQ